MALVALPIIFCAYSEGVGRAGRFDLLQSRSVLSDCLRKLRERCRLTDDCQTPESCVVIMLSELGALAPEHSASGPVSRCVASK